jgi:hypothetical protein
MPYLPGPIEHDLFLSYAHEDEPWVSALQEQLSERLNDLLECDCDIWQDKNKLFTGQDIPKELEKAIRASAAFVIVLSRSYRGSKWCEKELAAFLHEAEKKDGLETGGHRRLLRVIKFPWVGDAHKRFPRGYEELKAADFFDVDKTGQQREFPPKSARFRDAVYKLSSDIEKLFGAMLLGFEKVFVARAAEDATEERESIIREIRAVGYALSPPPEGVVPRESNREDLVGFIREARVTVHVLGADFDRDVREQIDLAKDAERRWSSI